MKKKIKKIILIILSVLAVYTIFNTTNYLFVRTKAEIYLCTKYHASPAEFELVDSMHSHIYWDDYNIFWLTPNWIDFSFEYKYNGRSFFVNRHYGIFYDDYQLDDIEKWCTEWLQENIDERITGIGLRSYDIVNYYKNVNKSFLTPIKEENIKDFIFNYTVEDIYYCIYYYDDNYSIKMPTTRPISQRLKNIINYEIPHKSRFNVKFRDKKMVKRQYRYDSEIWTNLIV